MRASLAYTMRCSVSAGLFGASLAIGALVPACANVITDWDDKALVLVTPMTAVGATSPYMAQRIMAMVHAAMFDAVNSIERRYRPYLVQLSADPATSKEAAAAAAAAALLATINEKTAAEVKTDLSRIDSRWRSEIERGQAGRSHRSKAVGCSRQRRLRCAR